jgi:thiol-disulfide isomerase/thioredoxin
VVWSAKDLQGNVISSTTLAGKIVIVDFWATWCPPCRREIPGLVELQKQYGDRGLVVVGFSLDESADAVRRFAQNTGVTYPLVMADENLVNLFGGVTSIPSTFVLDRKGHIVSNHLGYVDKQVFADEIKPLL